MPTFDASPTRPAPDAVFNQVPPLVEDNLLDGDAALRDAIVREGAAAALPELRRIGADLADPRNASLARAANECPPSWASFDPQGRRVDRIDFHPAWHALMRDIVARGFHAGPADDAAGGHTRRAAGYLMQARVEQGSLCPTTMTYGAVAALRREPWTADEWLPRIRSRVYDPRDLPADRKDGVLVGMGMTEKQGGSDVRTNTTVARACDADGAYRLTGHKWFYSAPQCDAHLVIARIDEGDGPGLTCFLVPRYTPDGAKNAVLVQRLKDKVGNRSNASSEVEFHGAWARRIGEPGRGIPTILEMGTYTRLDCVIGTAGMMREAVVQAIHHARHRAAFGAPLVAQPLMTSVLADLAIESEAATALALRLARAFDAGDGDDDELLFRRAMTSASKYWVCKRGPELAAEAMEVLGGNGYVEEGPLARIYREMPVNSIWEGSGNVMCLDVLRALARSRRTADVLLAELEPQRGLHPAFDDAFAALGRDLAAGAFGEASARGLVRRVVMLVQGALLLRAGSATVADAFCRTRLDGGARWGAAYGEWPDGCDAPAIVDRAWDGRASSSASH